MKKSMYTFFAVCSFVATATAQLPNPGFETWTNMGTYENPDGWATLNDLTTMSGIYTATKGTPGSPGSSYLKLTSHAANQKRKVEADWDKTTKMLTVTYDQKATNLDEILQKIADSGYDSDKFRASDEKYQQLHGCCKYERPNK